MCYNDCIENKNITDTTDNLIINFFEKGGRIDKFYLQNQRKGPFLVYLNGWYGGKNIRDAISKAFADQ